MRPNACSSNVKAVVATLAPAASFRNRRLLVRGFFTRVGPPRRSYALSRNEDIRKLKGAKGAPEPVDGFLFISDQRQPGTRSDGAISRSIPDPSTDLPPFGPPG